MDTTSAPDQDPVTQELVSAPVGDRCTNCQTPLAPDQRYCVNCGERRGKARFSFDALAAKPAAAPPPERRRHRPRVSSSVSFIAGVATLLLAVGVGVLIGHNNNTKSTPAASATPQVIKIQGNSGTSGSTGGSQAASKGSNTFKAPKVKLTPKVVKKVDQAASKVLGSGSKNLSSNPTQAVGGSCSGGSGCQGGKFTGNYFGQ
jgi:hypothetical protein